MTMPEDAADKVELEQYEREIVPGLVLAMDASPPATCGELEFWSEGRLGRG
jgi:hypothetical protein